MPGLPAGKTRLSTVAAGVAAALGTGTLVVAVADLLRPGSVSLPLIGVVAWAVHGPHLVLVSLVAAAVAVPVAARRPRGWFSGVAAAVSVAALVTSGVVTGSIVVAVVGAGGSVDPFAALAITTGSPEPDRTTTYAVVDGEPLQALVYEPGTTEGAPVMVHIHGGGWFTGAAKDSGTHPRWFADHGWYVVSVDYRLSTPDSPTWDEAPADVACALAWTARRAREAGADTTRLSVHGDSAGGNLAINAAWTAAAGTAVSTCPELGPVPVPEAVVAVYPVANPIHAYEHGNPVHGLSPRDFTNWYLGGTPAAHPDRLAAISPETHISDAAPATLIIQPERDNFIPARGNHELVAEARAGGVDVTVVGIPFTQHAFDLTGGSLGSQATLTTSARWLRDR
ncbi:alpha/beta hydrolase [Actinokineospora spheciospongiae]|uniref:alpha/beta hydrolase n=1 Tax=Actinokineospora spheciospongiae TaxID=909613 RepID=UPI000D90F9B2|nr:alpha/beta hydrolase [Actinokineospora spheciospongiae]PWW66824.1 acetyl esterase/lipase [Actinokineospora spheciospongiae]